MNGGEGLPEASWFVLRHRPGPAARPRHAWWPQRRQRGVERRSEPVGREVHGREL